MPLNNTKRLHLFRLEALINKVVLAAWRSWLSGFRPIALRPKVSPGLPFPLLDQVF